MPLWGIRVLRYLSDIHLGIPQYLTLFIHNMECASQRKGGKNKEAVHLRRIFDLRHTTERSTLFIKTRHTRHTLNARHIGLALCCRKELG